MILISYDKLYEWEMGIPDFEVMIHRHATDLDGIRALFVMCQLFTMCKEDAREAFLMGQRGYQVLNQWMEVSMVAEDVARIEITVTEIQGLITGWAGMLIIAL